jgi:hypothetical protein
LALCPYTDSKTLFSVCEVKKINKEQQVDTTENMMLTDCRLSAKIDDIIVYDLNGRHGAFS